MPARLGGHEQGLLALAAATKTIARASQSVALASGCTASTRPSDSSAMASNALGPPRRPSAAAPAARRRHARQGVAVLVGTQADEAGTRLPCRPNSGDVSAADPSGSRTSRDRKEAKRP